MGLFGKLRDKFLGMDNPLGKDSKNTEPAQKTQGVVRENLEEVMIGKHTTPVSVTKHEQYPQDQTPVTTGQHHALTLDVLDLSRVIDIYAESQAIEAFDEQMRNRKGDGFFSKIGGFFKRSFQRMGRDAWIDSKKREYIESVKEGLKNGTYTEESLREHVQSGNEAIAHDAHLVHEEVHQEEQLPKAIQDVVDAWLATPAGSPDRTDKIKQLKAVIEENYPTITADLSQLEQSLIRLERAKIHSEVETLDAKLNILDIGRIEQGNGKRKEGWFVQMADKISAGVNRNHLPDWVKEKVIGALRHPNTAAIVTAMGTRAGVSAIVGTAALTGFSGGFLLPVALGSAAGGFFASVRARREMRDRTAEIDRRGAQGLETGTKLTDGESSNTSHQTNHWQRPVMDLYARIANAKENPEDALIAGISYLVKHRVGREDGINMLQYDADKSVSRQHVEMIRLMNEIFPGLVASFNDRTLFDPKNTSSESELAKKQYDEIKQLAQDTMSNRMREEGNYALKQGAIFGGVAFGVGTSVGLAVHGLLSGTSGHWESIPGSGTKQYPGGLQGHTNVHRGFWYDNNTPSPKFDHTELMIHTDKSGGWNVSNMLQKTSSSSLHHSHTTTAQDFSSGKIQALVTPKKGGPSFLLPIDAKGNIMIPESMRSAFNTRNFAYLEVGEVGNVHGDIHINPLATVVGKGDMVYDMVSGPSEKEWIPGTDVPWYTPRFFGVNRYHELGKRKSRPPISGFIDRTPIQEPMNEKAKEEEPHNISQGIPVAPIIQQEEDPVGTDDLWEGEDTDRKDFLSKEKESLDDLWKQIVTIRERLEKRRTGELALADTEVVELENMVSENPREGTTSLLVEYWKKRDNWNSQIQEIEKQPPLEGSEQQKYQENIRSLIRDGILVCEDDKPIIYHFYGRTIVAVKTRNGEIIPFYRSAHGTTGKKASNWYPCFGIADDGGWIIKGTLKGLNSGHGVKELKELQDTLNRHLNWDHELDRDFAWNKARNPLVQAGAVITDFTKKEEKKQTTEKPTGPDDEKVRAWIVEWVTRVAGLDKTTNPPKLNRGINPGEEYVSQSTQETSSEESDTHQVEQNFKAAARNLGIYSDNIDPVVQRSWIRDQQNFLLQGKAHREYIEAIMQNAKRYGGMPAMRAISAFYAKNGHIWLSPRTTVGMASPYEKNIALGVADHSNNEYSRMSMRLYEIASVNPLPDPITVMFFHELGHQITMGQMIESPTQKLRSLIEEVNTLRDEQSAGITPLSSMSFYQERVRQNPNYNTQFWEDMAELMGLYLAGREYVVAYLDDRIRVRRDMKATISEGLRDRIMEVLDSAYSHYIR